MRSQIKSISFLILQIKNLEISVFINHLGMGRTNNNIVMILLIDSHG